MRIVFTSGLLLLSVLAVAFAVDSLLLYNQLYVGVDDSESQLRMLRERNVFAFGWMVSVAGFVAVGCACSIALSLVLAGVADSSGARRPAKGLYALPLGLALFGSALLVAGAILVHPPF